MASVEPVLNSGQLPLYLALLGFTTETAESAKKEHLLASVEALVSSADLVGWALRERESDRNGGGG